MAFPTVLLEILRLSTALALAIKNISAYLYFYLPDYSKNRKMKTNKPVLCLVSIGSIILIKKPEASGNLACESAYCFFTDVIKKTFDSKEINAFETNTY